MLVNDKHYWLVIQQFTPMFDFKTFIHIGRIVSRNENDEDQANFEEIMCKS